MRLINTETLELEEFIGSQTPSYAILSHTWGNEEVSLQDWYNRNDSSSNVSTREGYAKILGFCKIAREDDYRYVWVDTCCIDKTSSAELTESINSMFRWYEQAEVCYIYLKDFDVSASSFHEGAAGCRWFTRGWTLQELIAPVDVLFYDLKWQFRGTRMEQYKELMDITGIDSQVLTVSSPYSYSVADRMSWAASRQTMRKEDNAYCLLGLFGVNLPLIYGEGMGAFRRLQEAIIKSKNDLSILAWGISPKTVDADTATALVVHRTSEGGQIQDQQLFATSPSDFLHSKDVYKLPSYHCNPEFPTTNKGLRVEANLVKGGHTGSRGYFLELASRKACRTSHSRIWLKLRTISTDVYVPESLVEAVRDPGRGLEIAGYTGLRSFYISYEPPRESFTGIFRFPKGIIHIPELDHIQLKKMIPETRWDEARRESFEVTEESARLVLAALFEAQVPLQNSKMEFIVMFDTMANEGLEKRLCQVLDCREYPQQSDWILSDRGPGRELLWPDLIFNMPEVMQLGDKLHVEVGGALVGLRVTLHDGFPEKYQYVKMAIETLDEDR